MKIRNLCALLLALMLLALAGCGQKEQLTQPENPDVPQEEAAAPVRLVCSNGSTTLRFSREDLPPGRELCPDPAGDGAGH